MSHNTFGHLFRVTTFGESHGPGIGCIVDGCPPGLELEAADLQLFLDKRRPGQSRFTTQRQEPDQVRIASGVMPDPRSGKQVTTGTPIGLLVGTYLAEYAQNSRLGNAVRFVSDVLLSAPSILIGLFVYSVLVRPFGGFSGIAGCVALAVIVIPIVVRTTEDMLRLIPVSLREAAVALGAPKWKMIVLICYRAALDGIATGVLLAVARVAGETAPLLFTSLGNLNWSLDITQPMSSLPVTIYQYAGSAFDDWVQLAWVGALLITFGVLAINVVASVVLRPRQ